MALRILRRYERWRKSENELMSLAIDSFNRFLARGTGPVSRLAQRGLGWVNRSSELKRLFIGRALGVSGELPQAFEAHGIRESQSKFLGLFSSHPPIEARIAALQAAA